MKVFISWSGIRSRFLAEALRSWFPRVLQSVKAWMSDEDISAGSRWLTEISNQLSDARVGIICVTPENQANPWLLFEAGALSKTLEQTYVCPILFDLAPSQLSGPLAQFQANEAKHEGLEKVINTLNMALKDAQLPSEDLTEIFEVWWPKLAARLEEMPAAPTDKPQKRPVEDLLEEIVSNTREQIRRENVRLEAYQERDEKIEGMFELMRSSMAALQDRSSAFADVVAKGPKLEDLFRQLPSLDASQIQRAFASLEEMKKLPSLDVSQMQRAFASLEEMKIAEKSLREKLLKGRPDSGGSDDQKA